MIKIQGLTRLKTQAIRKEILPLHAETDMSLDEP